MKYALTAKAMQYLDEYTISKGIPSAVLMENAARGVVEEIVRRFPSKDQKVLVLAGPGNNGGDAVCAARWLARLGFDVRIYFIGNRSRISKEFARQARIARKQHPSLEIIGGFTLDETLLPDAFKKPGIERNRSTAHKIPVAYNEQFGFFRHTEVIQIQL